MALSPAELREIEEQSVPFSGVKREAAAPSAVVEGGSAAFPTAMEKATEVALGTAQGAAETGPILAGGLTGFRAGMAAAPFMGPFAPAGPIIGTGAGLISGYLAGQGITSFFPGVKREDLAPYREGGKTFGSSIAFAPVAFGIPVMQGNRISRFISDIGETARKYPKIFTTSEILGGAGAGVGGGIAVEYAPDSPGARFVAETAGGFFAPGRFVTNLSGTALGLVRNLKNEMSVAGRQSTAANKIFSALDEAGEDIPALIKRLEAMPLPGAKPTAAQITGSPTLSALETTLARGNAKFGADTLTQGQEAMIAYRELIRRLEATGNPQAVRAAAQARMDYNKGLLEGRLAQADADSAASIVKITRDTPQTRAEIGRIVKENTTKALKDARDYEHQLWTDAIRDLTKREKVPVTSRRFTNFYDDNGDTVYKTVTSNVIQGRQMRPESTISGFLDMTLDIPDIIYKNTTPKIVKDIMASFGVTDDVVKAYKAGRNTEEFMKTGKVPDSFLATGTPFRPNDIDIMDLANYRSQLLTLAREASGKGDLNNARFYGQLAEGLLQDLNRLDLPSFDAARAFSKDLNDTFTRTFADEVTAKNIAGGQKIPAEVLVNRAYGSNADLTALRMKEIEDAAGFMLNKYKALPDKRTAEAVAMRPFAKTSNDLVGSIQDAQTRVLRLAAAQSIDPATGRIQVGRLNKFVSENKEALDRLGITNDLTDAVKAENLFKAVEASNSRLAKVAQNQSAFGRVLKFENPTAAVTDALNSKFPVKNINQMTKMVRNAGPDAVEGLKSSMFDYAFVKAGGEDKFNPIAYKKALFDPIAPGQPSLINIMRSQDLLTQAEARNLRRITDSMDRVQLAMKNRVLMDDLVQDASALDDLVMRLIGVNLAEKIKPSGPGSLVIAGAGSQAVRNMLGKMPNMLVRGVMEEAAKDPQLMAQLLRRGMSEGEKIRLARQLHGYLGAAGLNYATFEEPPPQEQPAGPTASQMIKKLPPAPPTKGVPGMQLGKPAQPPAQPTPGPQSAAPGTSRQMLSQLFPFDTISGMGG